jgi:hypothetical protein
MPIKIMRALLPVAYPKVINGIGLQKAHLLNGKSSDFRYSNPVWDTRSPIYAAYKVINADLSKYQYSITKGDIGAKFLPKAVIQ